ncbi:hypothetical protein HZH68_004772 [Vespula germanica]|uniref:Endoplasmic reticulum junction formation protein lunapark n=1 Tax=Vespula germanica TaxID=30212 RepID=A0A834KP66_VESGE|nr:hypothetical protein HZH68_004772 [Vespula germanica]
MADEELQEELEILRKTRRDLQEYYYLLRILRNDIEKMRSNFLFTSVDLSGKLAGTVLDASHIDTSICIKYFTKKMIREALTKTNIVALMDESDLNIHKDPYVQFNSCSKYIHQIIEDIITICPMALVAIFTKPVTATLSMISEIYKHAGKWDPNRLIGSASMEIMRIETITGNILDLNPASISIPIAGGADLDTVVPLLSCAKPIDGFITVRAYNSTLVELFQATEQEKTHSNVKKFALLDGNAAVKLILTLASGLSGIDNIYACAFVRSNVLPVCRFFTSQLQFGLRGIKENFGLPKVSPLEINMIEKAIPIINEYVEMGVKKTTIEILEDLDSKIKEIQEYGQNTEQKHKKIVGTLVIYSVVLYITTAFIFYFYFFPASLYDQIFYITPLLIFPIIILFTKKMVSWYYKRKISRNQEKLITMQQEKSKILDEVTETETYKKAKEILLRFAPDQLKMTSTSVKVPQTVETLRQPNVPHIIASSSPGIGEIRRRTVGNPNQSPNVSRDINARSLPVDGTPNKSTQLNTPIQTGSRMLSNTSMGYRTPEYTLARPVLPHHRSNFDRLIDYLVGDGPSNRYALICRQCECHNGMALKEEFEYLGFRCCYCNFWNPPRKQKPGVQRIEDVSSNTSPTSGTLANDSSDKIIKTSKLPEVEASCSSDTDSDIELVERPAEISENQEHINDNYTDSNINEKGLQSSEDKKSSEEMEVED